VLFIDLPSSHLVVANVPGRALDVPTRNSVISEAFLIFWGENAVRLR
jgi:hypothetical protein